MRFILHNPHIESHFGITLSNFLTHGHSFNKFKYLLDFLKNENKRIAIFLDGKTSSLPEYIGKYIPVRLEICIWMILNKVNPFRVKVITDHNKIEADDVFFSFTYNNLDKTNSNLSFLNNDKFLKVFHTTHFVMRTKKIAENFKKLKINILIAENNLAKNSKYFRRHFPEYKSNVYVLPYVCQERFIKKTAFNKRKNKCVATGTIIKINEFKGENNSFSDFYEFYKSPVVHPLRLKLFIHKEMNKEYVDCFITNFWEKERKEKKDADSVFVVVLKRLYNGFFASKRNYFKIDIVDLYNQYRMFVVPEELNDLPGIGFVEGMSCGSVYVGKIDPMYSDLGMISGKHYIGHDGTEKDLLNKIKYYQQNQKELEVIAKEGYLFAKAKFNGSFVAKSFWNDILKLQKEFQQNSKGVLKVTSSFVKN